MKALEQNISLATPTPDYSRIFCSENKSRAAAQRIVAEAVRPRSGVPEYDEPRSGDRVFLMCNYTINRRHDISHRILSPLRGFTYLGTPDRGLTASATILCAAARLFFSLQKIRE